MNDAWGAVEQCSVEPRECVKIFTSQFIENKNFPSSGIFFYLFSRAEALNAESFSTLPLFDCVTQRSRELDGVGSRRERGRKSFSLLNSLHSYESHRERD
jgi:hypothetical protein